MRTVTVKRDDTGESKEITLRPLKRKEVRSLRDYGYGPMHCLPKIDTAEDAVEKALAAVLPDEDQKFLDECSVKEAVRFWKELLKETYGDRDEEKNLSATTGGTSTEKESTTVEPAKDTTKDHPSA